MNSTLFCLSLLICSLSSAQDSGNFSEACYPDFCELLQDFGALKEKLASVEDVTQKNEERLSQCEIRHEASETRQRSLEYTLRDVTRPGEILMQHGEIDVIFSAATGGEGDNIGPFVMDTTLIYGRVITNIGEAYDEYSGYFTAPVAGVYYFTFFYHSRAYYSTSLILFKNGEPIVASKDSWTFFDHGDNGGNAVFLHLQPHDQVYVVLEENTYVRDSMYHTTFSGFLVTPM